MAGRIRNIQVIFRVDERERGLIRQKMELMGVRNMQAYLRKMAIDGYAVKLDLPELREAVAMLGRYNGNINQIAKNTNMGMEVTADILKEVLEMQKQIWERIKNL